MSEALEAQLIAERLKSSVQLLRAEVAQLEAAIKHDQELWASRVGRLEKNADDFEARIRALTDAAVQFKLLAGLATGGGLLSLLALLRELLR